MDVIDDCVAGLDVHKDTVVACVRTMSGTRAMRECRTYETTTDGLLPLLDWLSSSGCSVVAMEATGVYWLPVWKILSDGDFKLVLGAKRRSNRDCGGGTWIVSPGQATGGAVALHAKLGHVARPARSRPETSGGATWSRRTQSRLCSRARPIQATCRESPPPRRPMQAPNRYPCTVFVCIVRFPAALRRCRRPDVVPGCTH